MDPIFPNNLDWWTEREAGRHGYGCQGNMLWRHGCHGDMVAMETWLPWRHSCYGYMVAMETQL